MPQGFLYEQVGRDIAKAIKSGLYSVGERLPSLRQLTIEYSVSLATAVQAYEYLDEQGLIESQPKRGYFVRQTKQLVKEPQASTPKPKPTKVNVAELAMSLITESRQKGLVRLGAAVPGVETLPLASIARAMAGVARRKYLNAGMYEDAQGHPELRKQIARLMRDAGYHAHPEEIIITNGCLEALGLALRVTAKPGDTIAIESPTYFGVLQTIENLGMKALELPTHPRDGIDLVSLKKACHRHKVAACILVPTFNNPLGSCMPEENRRKLVKLLARNKIPLIEDDEYGFLSYSARRPKAIKAYDERDRVIYCSSFSKTVAPGLRLGWMVSDRYSKAIKYQKFLDNISTAIHPQLAMAEFLAKGGFRRCTRKAAQIYHHRMEQFRAWVSEYFPAGTRLSNPQGGFILWLVLPNQVDAFALYHEAMQKKIAITPGCLFSAQEQFTHHIRISCGVVEGDQARRSLRNLAELVKRHIAN